MKQKVNVGNAKHGNIARKGYTSVLQKIAHEDVCPFCEKNITLFHPNPILFKNKSWIVTKNAWPYEGSKHHFLLISRTHISSIEDGSPEIGKELFAAYKKLVTQFAIPGATLFVRSGNTFYTGGTVTHLHAQVVSGAKRTSNTTHLDVTVSYKKK